MKDDERIENEFVEYKNIPLPIGAAKVEGPIEDFEITIYDRTGNTFRYRAVGGNLCSCNNYDAGFQINYEVK